LANLSGYLVIQEKYEEAKTPCQKALFILENSLGHHNSVTKICASNLIFILNKLGKKDEIEALKQRWNQFVFDERKHIQRAANSALKNASTDVNLLEMEWRSTVPKQCTPVGVYLPNTFVVNLFQQQTK